VTEVLVGLPIAVDRDLVSARAAARAAAQAVGFATPQQTRFATAVSELVRTALFVLGGGELQLAITTDPGGVRLDATVIDRKRRKSAVDIDTDAGIAIARRLTEHFETTTDVTGGTRLTLGIALPRGRPFDQATIERWRDQLVEVVGRTDLDHLRDRNVEMAAMLEQLEAQIERAETAVAEVAEARRVAEAASASKAAFLAYISHEIRTPLHAILGFAELLHDTELTADQLELLEPLRTSGLHLRSLINDTLDLSKIESGRLELEGRPFEIRGCVDEALDLLAAQAVTRRVELIAVVDRAVPAVVIGDETRVRQILMNYLSNAVKFSRDAAVSLHVTVTPAGDAAELCFEVRDRGVGIPPEMHDRLFQPFTQADATTTRTFGGTGLGLSINASLAGLMGGRVWFESEPGTGSTFFATVVLPVGPSSVDAGSDGHHIVRRSPPGDELPPMRVLLVDDSAPSQDVGQHLLASLGIQPAIAANGRQALAVVQTEPYDVVLMDLDMPIMNGFAATQAIRSLGTAVHQPWIVAMTANAMHGERDRCLAVGMNDYLAKPVDRERLRAALHSATAQATAGPLA
jgi:signal transduction histidine kinase/ActR/RegA family two-component response regulator